MSERRNVFITGASRGIGHATATYFVRQGWRAITCSREVVPEGCPRDERHDHITVDLGDTANLGATVGQLDELLDGAPLHALINNAGYSPKGEAGARLGCLDGDMATWQKTFAINFLAPVFFSRIVAPRLARTGGTVVNITSIAGHRVHPFAGSAYATSKAALTALTRELAADLAHLGIRVNAVCPGEINTAILSPGTAELVERIPLRRLGSPEEVAAVIYYLATDQSSYITGAEIPVNGGQDVY
ncbi:MAG TPA: SDR family oxidoreductase [Geminicoccaceae bacterium]|jgi:NAD(P)-dependent dehydrogenase (short-subunit alcohol dehydrogenase family)|nr:SDR family oxidoreductase [Geminicoccaceae bacterium]